MASTSAIHFIAELGRICGSNSRGCGGWVRLGHRFRLLGPGRRRRRLPRGGLGSVRDDPSRGGRHAGMPKVFKSTVSLNLALRDDEDEAVLHVAVQVVVDKDEDAGEGEEGEPLVKGEKRTFLV